MEEADFSGYATKAGLRCADGKTIMPDAFKHQDKMRVPLVWQHGHDDPENVLGHTILENRPDGVYTYGFFNSTPKAEHAKNLLAHKDVNMLSIWANQLIERSGRVMHGSIREVSLVLSGANPGALIENVTIAHSDMNGEDYETVLDDEAIIFTGLELMHADTSGTGSDSGTDDSDTSDDGRTVGDVYNAMTEEQQAVVQYMVGEALSSDGDNSDSDSGSLKQDNLNDDNPDETVKDVYDSMTPKQQDVLHYMIGEALESAGDNTGTSTDSEGNKQMSHNVFDQDPNGPGGNVISHDDMKAIITDAKRVGSLKDALEGYALSHGITDIDTLFPDAVAMDKTPQFLARRSEWVNDLLGGISKSPFSRIKTLSADLTYEEARAKGYVKGNMKKEEFFTVSKRTTTPTTVYKKQALDRDDVVDITDFDVVLWLKGEMRVMLDEELARAALIGDGRDIASDDKINEQNIRPIAKDSELFTTTVNVNIDDAGSSTDEIIDALITNRKYYKGTGLPNFYTSETTISKFLLLKDTLGRKIYKNLQEVADDIRVASIVPVEVLEEDPTTVGILVNPADYTMGATAGGQVNMFDDFDIDYNKQKYLIETRLCGALTKLKSAIVVKAVPGANVLVSPAAPTFDEDTSTVSIVDTAHVVYKNAAGTAITTAGSPYTVAAGDVYLVTATPAAGYYFATSEDDSWAFTGLDVS